MEPRDPTPNTFHLTIQSYNVEFDHFRDPATVAAVGRNSADVMALQEVTPEWEEVLRREYADSYSYMLFYAEPNSGGMAVLSRFPIVDLGFHPGPNDWHPAWHVGVETPAGPMQLLNVHLRAPLNGRDSSVESYLQTDEDHRLSIEQFRAECDGALPTVVLGDFNEGVDGEAVRVLEDNGYRNVLPLYRPGQGTWRYRSIGGQFDATYDHILFDDAFDSLNAWVTRAGNSDHLPVVAHLEVSPNW
jgi:endonuclease/exonuclease/phosphatase family metal-dependent hydrolase